MATSRKKIELGLPFSMLRPTTGEQEFEVTNLHNNAFDHLVCKITNSTSYRPPDAWVVDDVNQIVKVKGFEGIPQSTALQLIVQGVTAEKIINIEKRVLLSDQKLQTVKAAPAFLFSTFLRYIKRGLLAFIIVSVILYAMKGTKFGDMINSIWARFNAAQVITLAEDLDWRIMTNKHPVYQSAAFTEMNAQYKRNHGSRGELSKLYNYVGGSFFVTGDLILDIYDNPRAVDREEAEEYCDLIGGRLLDIEELQVYLAHQYLGVENFIWPIARQPDIAEWSNSNHSWDDYYIFLKKAANPTDNPIDNGVTWADEDNYKLAFRCGFSENFYIPVE